MMPPHKQYLLQAWLPAHLGSKKGRRSAGLELALENAVPVTTRGPQDRAIVSLFNIVSIHKLRYFCISASLPVLASEREARYQS